ncbi:MAG: hypothetical protein IJ532_03500 [Alphaproteobacteria bacterium]|nr:hypothetical protein [Alphaproteobacteria bacterium]
MPIDFLTSLIPSQNLELWNNYLKFINLGKSRFFYEKDRISCKEEKLRLLEKAVRRDLPVSDNILSRLQQEFLQENLSVSLLSDWLAVWRYTATLPLPLNEKRLSDIIGYAASPAARMIIALNNENPSIYLPFSSLVSAVLFMAMETEKDDLFKGSKWSLKQKRSKLKGWLKNSRILLSVIRSKRLKFKTALLLNRLKIYERDFQNNKQFKIGFLDEVSIFLYSMCQFMTIRYKSVAIKEM